MSIRLRDNQSIPADALRTKEAVVTIAWGGKVMCTRYGDHAWQCLLNQGEFQALANGADPKTIRSDAYIGNREDGAK